MRTMINSQDRCDTAIDYFLRSLSLLHQSVSPAATYSFNAPVYISAEGVLNAISGEWKASIGIVACTHLYAAASSGVRERTRWYSSRSRCPHGGQLSWRQLPRSLRPPAVHWPLLLASPTVDTKYLIITDFAHSNACADLKVKEYSCPQC